MKSFQIKFKIYFRKYLTHIIIFPIFFFQFEKKISYFYDFFIFIIIMYIWKVCLFRNILIVKIYTLTKE